mgnify:CR=1 FL=1
MFTTTTTIPPHNNYPPSTQIDTGKKIKATQEAIDGVQPRRGNVGSRIAAFVQTCEDSAKEMDENEYAKYKEKEAKEAAEREAAAYEAALRLRVQQAQTAQPSTRAFYTHLPFTNQPAQHTALD